MIVRYKVVKIGNYDTITLVREIVSENDEVVSSSGAPLEEVLAAAPEVIAEYFSELSSQLSDVTTYLAAPTTTVDSQTYYTLGSCYHSIKWFVETFDRNLLPPD
jgi:hypothetical protein